ncbi:MAG: DUF1559 domain-containing protein [Gemmataceae bacterium]
MARDRYDRYDDDDYDRPRRRKKSGGSSGATIALVVGGVTLMLLIACGGALYFVLRGAKKIGAGLNEFGERATASQNAEEIYAAFDAYQNANGRFPPPYLKAKDGKPGLSWRVAILPFLDDPRAKALHPMFKLDEPWDSPTNRPLLDQMPPVFLGPAGSAPNQTRFRVFMGRETMFDPIRQGVRVQDVTDGLAKTILFVEAEQAVPWTKPEELEYDPKKPLPALHRALMNTYMVVAADGEIHDIEASMPEEKIRKWIIINDGWLKDPDW